jgi:uncharacterized repeat protein (TIGR03943 family)
VSREVQSVLLVLFGGAVLRLTVSGSYTNYVKPGLGPFLTAAGVLLVVLGLWSALSDGLLRRSQRPLDDAEDGHGHVHGHGGPRVAWLLLLPALTVFLVAPPPLGAFAASRDPVSVARPTGSVLPALPPGDPVDVGVVDYAIRAVWDEGRTLSGRTVRMVGFVTPDPAGGWFLTRIQLACCAADGQAYRIKVLDAPERAADSWVEVTGRWEPGGGVQRDDAIPNVRAVEVVDVEQPENPYG